MAAQVQDTMSSAALAGFAVPVSVVMITQAQNWQTRQQIQYAAMKGLLKNDFLGLDDYQEQVTLYSNANPVYLKAPYTAIKPLMPRNRKVLMSLVLDPVMGWVGNFLQKIYGIQKTFVAPANILNNTSL